MSSAKADVARATEAMGKSSLITPAIIIGTEQASVTRMVKTTLNISTTDESSLDINGFFKNKQGMRHKGVNIPGAEF